MKKRFELKALSAVLLMLMLVVTACSGGNNGNGNGTNQASSAPTAAQTEDGEEASPSPENREPVTLKIISWKDTYGELYDMFEKKYPWITIEQIPVNSQPIMEIIASLEAAGTPADLTEIDSDLISFDQAGLLEDLTPYIDQDPTFNETEFPNGFFDTMTWNGKKLAVPMVDVPMWILVNKDLLNKHGQAMPPNDWTYEDFRNIAKAITDPQAGEFGLTTQSEWQMRLLSTKAIADGHAANIHYLNEDMSQSVLHTPEVLDDVRWLQEFVTNDGSLQSFEAATAGGDVTREFINGKTGFAIGGDWVLPNLKANANFEWDVLPFPRGEVSQPGYTIYGPLAMLASSKHKEEAFLWISFQFSKEAQKWKIDQGANASIIDPDIMAYYDQTPMWEGKNKEAVKLAKENAYIQPGLTVPAFGEYNWNNILNEVIFMGADINTIVPGTEAWNKRTLEVRAELGQ
ncbi:ABC transporter substrate-binding protein [Paenibacillus soyae]|uniref:Extracellular solute-binding protein n=1 Tax=Paenibacillus soyae TaxID=2969249 RepID=A0A9X2MWC9_9BACL|nr:extracellular solute-binding protein [Paenibacillus soyae]MCR2807046.1 extracellular solute-binding protein [Paenibacillus soyae]